MMRIGGVLGALAAVATLAAPSSALSAKWQHRVFKIAYDGSGSVDFHSQGSSTDTGCFRTIDGSDSYGFAQDWRFHASFKALGKGRYQYNQDSVAHVSGPNDPLSVGGAHLQGTQTPHDGDCEDFAIGGPDTGTFDCRSGPPTLTAWNKPEIDIVDGPGDFILLARAFVDAHLRATGTDTIPTDKSCAKFNDDWTYGTTLIPGSYATAKVSLPVKELATMRLHQSMSKTIGLGQNTEAPPQQTCGSTFGEPRVCTITSQTLRGELTVTRTG